MIKKHVTLAWLHELIRSGDTSPFYHTREWVDLRNRKLEAEHYECERCRAKGRFSPGDTVHHKEYLRKRPELALDYKNLEVLCKECHYEEHHQTEQLNEERW